MSEKHILVVDDSPSTRRMIAACLRECGFAVTEATDGAAALEAVRKQADGKHDLVITDQVMPAMDGLTLIRALRRRHDPRAGACRRRDGFPAQAVRPGWSDGFGDAAV